MIQSELISNNKRCNGIGYIETHLKWGKRISLAEKAQGKALTYEQRAALANTLENTADKIRIMEATNPGSVG